MSPRPIETKVTPEMGRIKIAMAIFGVSRSWIYRAGAVHPNLFRKAGRTTLVDFSVLRGILAALPTGPIQSRRKGSEE